MKKMEDMMKKMNAKSGKMSDQDKSAKEDVLKELLDMAHGMMGKKVKDGMGAMKASVTASNKQDLEKGLDKAKEVVKMMKHDGEPDEYPSADDEESFGDLGQHDSNSLGEEAERDRMLDDHMDAEKVDSEDESRLMDDDEYDGLFARKHKEDRMSKKKK